MPLLFLLACTTPSTPPLVLPVLEGPQITHEVPAGAWFTGDTVTLSAMASDPDGVDAVELRYRRAGELAFERVELTGDPASATVVVEAPGLEYRFVAFDGSDLRIARTAPTRGVYVVPVQQRAVPAPWEVDFDAEEVDFGLYDFGWSDAAFGFRGNRWRHGGPAFSGDRAAVHREGFVGMEPVDDWLVAPVSELLELDSAEVRWMERGGDGVAADLSFWVSTGSPDPADGDYERVTELEPPPGEWRQAPVVDLSSWAGADRLTLAWRYEGAGEVDRWIVDAVRLGDFSPDLRLVEATPTFVEPGDAGSLAVRVRNGGAPLGPVALSGSWDAAGVGTFDAPLDLGPLETGEEEAIALGFGIDPEQPDNRVVTATLSASDGGGPWTVPVRIGDPSVGTVAFTTVDSGLVFVRIGAGDPRAPHAEVLAFQGTLAPGPHVVMADLDPYVDLLPPLAGRLRWWTQIESAGPASLDAFSIDFDGLEIFSTSMGPVDAAPDGRFWLPERARISVDAPEDPLQPGQSTVLSLTVDNVGGATVGPTELRWSPPPELTLDTDTSPLPTDWAGGAVTLQVPVTVAPDHTDSRPLVLRGTVVDASELYPVELTLSVPWPRLGFGTPVLADGGGDGVLDPGESGLWTIPVRNDGALASGPATCTMQDQSQALSDLEPGAASSVTFAVDAVGASDGDTLARTVTCADGQGTWNRTFALGVGGAPWIALPADATGDGAALDLFEGRFRVAEEVLELELTAVGPVDPSALGIELWMDASGSAWRNQVVTVVGGEPSLWGLLSGGWNPLVAPELTVDGSVMTFRIDVPSLGLSDDTLQLAVGAGFCGTAELYCDHWPDGWGNPYGGTPLVEEDWLTLTW